MFKVISKIDQGDFIEGEEYLCIDIHNNLSTGQPQFLVKDSKGGLRFKDAENFLFSGDRKSTRLNSSH